MSAASPTVTEMDMEPGRLAAFRKRFLSTRALVIALVMIIVGYLGVVPLYYLIRGTFFEDGFTLDGFKDAYSSDGIGELVTNSLTFAVGATVLSLVVGTLLAYLYVRTDVPFKQLFFAASIVPLIIPGILYTVAWILLASPEIGLINKFLEPVLGKGFFNIFSIKGMIWVEGLHLAPLVFLLMTAAFRSMDPSLEESSLMSGAGRWTTLRKITVPLVRPAVISSTLIMVVNTLGSFEVPTLLGLKDGIYVFTSRIYFLLRRFPVDMPSVGALALGLLVIAIIGVFISDQMGKRSSSFQTVTGKGFRPRPMELGRARPYMGVAVIIYFVVTVVLPLAVLVYASLLKYYQAPSLSAIESFSLDNYREAAQTSGAFTALKNSVLLGVGSATIVMIMMAVAAWIVVRSKTPGRQLINQFSFLPLVIPGLVLGLALSFVYLRSPIPIYGTLWILLISYCTRYMPYGMRYAMTSMEQISAELEESAQVSGASWWNTFRRVLLPLIMPGLIAGWVYILVVSFRELSSSILLYSPGNEVLAILIFDQYQNGDLTVLAAIGVVMVLILVTLVTVTYRFGARFGISQN